MILALVLGAGVGVGLFAIVRGLHPPVMPLGRALLALHAPPPSQQTTSLGREGVVARAGRPIARALEPREMLPRAIRADLAVLERPAEPHVAEKAALALTGALLAPATAAVLALGGVRSSWALPVWAALLCTTGGFLAPDLGVHAEATRRRASFGHALGSFLDLVVIALAGGAGVEGALAEAASVGQGFAFSRIRGALEAARLSRVAPWETLAALGEELGIAELRELAASVSLAGTEGARVRASLAAKAASLRSHQLAEEEAREQAASERMSLPVVVLFCAFLVFVAYPAIVHVLTGL